jgi:hypothetical protein
MKKYIVILATLLVAGCSTANLPLIGGEKLVNGVPVWVNSPKAGKNEVVGIGIAPKNMKGRQAQRKSAVSKAIDEIASQLGTTVNSVVKTAAHSDSSGNASSSMSAYSFQTVDGKVVQAFIKKTYRNPKTGVLYIMMVGKVK